MVTIGAVLGVLVGAVVCLGLWAGFLLLAVLASCEIEAPTSPEEWEL